MDALGASLQQKLAGTRRWWRTTRILSGIGWIVSVVILLGLLCYHADRALTLSATAREAWRIGIGLAALATMALALLRPVLRKLSDSAVAAQIERRYPVLRERLLSTMDLVPALAASGSAVPFSRPMAVALIEETTREAAPLDFRRAVNLRPLRIATLTTAATLLLLALHIVFAPEAFAVWLQRMATPRADIAPFARTRVWITPEAEVLPRGEGLTVTVTTRGAVAERSLLRYREEGDPNAPWKTIELTRPLTDVLKEDSERRPAGSSAPNTLGPESLNAEKDATQRQFQYRFPALTRSITLSAMANDGRSNERAVTVEDRPALLNMRLTFHFPAYMKRPPQTLAESSGNILAPVGTEVAVEATANKPLRSAEYVQEKQAARPWQVEGEKVAGTIPVNKSTTYRLLLTDQRGFDNPATPRFEIQAQKDEPPTVQIQRPAADVDLVPNASLPLIAQATDDYGVASMRLHYDAESSATNPVRAAPRKPLNGSLPLEGPNGDKQARVEALWRLGGLQLRPGDVIRYQVSATDNDTLNGPHIGRSQTYRIRIISLLEMQRLLKGLLDEEARAIEQLRQRQIAAQRLLQAARQKPDAAQVSRAQEAQRAVAQEARSLAQRANEISARLENNNLTTQSELERRDEAVKLLQALAEKKMPTAADTMPSPDMLRPNDAAQRESLANADRQQSDIRRDIEKAQQLLSRTLTPEQLAKEAQRLAQEQQRLADSARFLAEDLRAQKEQFGTTEMTEDQRSGLEMERRQQAQANADTERLQQQLERATAAARERGQTEAAKALQRAAEQLKQGQAQANQQKAQQALQRNDPQTAAPAQDRAAAALQKAAEAAQQASGENPDRSPRAAAARLEQAAERLREMAEQQKRIAEQVAQAPDATRSKQLGQQERALQQRAQQMQQALQDARNASQSLQQAQQNLGQASQQLQQNRSQSAKTPSRDAARQLDRAAQQAQQAAQQMRQQQAAQEMADRVERLAQVQRGLQNVTKRLDERRQNGQLNETEQRELNQAAEKQEQAEQQARDLARQMPSPAFQQALRMASRQMRPASSNLNRREPDTGQDTQAAQNRAARTLETVAQALKQQAQNGPSSDPQSQQGQQSGAAQQSQQAAALGELALALGLQQQLREDTGALDKARARNRDQRMTPQQLAENGQLTQGQQETQQMTERAAEQLHDNPGLAPNVRDAAQQMGQAGQRLQQQETGQPTQAHQDNAIQQLDQVVRQMQQQMQQQQQQQQAQQQAQQGAPQPGQQQGNQPDKSSLTRLEDVRKGRLGEPNSRNGRGFGGLSPRAQRALREGQQERAPAEYQDLVNRYYKALAEKKR